MKPFVDFTTYNATNPFGAYDPVFYPMTHHHIGSDFKVKDIPITAPTDGEVFKAVYNSSRGNTAVFVFSWEGKVWGLELCHLRELPVLGTFKQGQIIATSGNTGTATTSPHLHAVLHKDAKVTKNYQDLVNEQAFFLLRDEERIVDPYCWFRKHFNTV